MEKSMKSFVLTVFVGILVGVGSCADVWAQATAQISGTAKDQSGAVLPGVEIKVTQTETGISRDAVTNETGSYVLPNLPIGPYRLEAALPGFRTYAQTGIVLQVNSSPSINVVLEVGQVTEQVEVEANAALVETRSAGVGAVIENARILDLPLNGRNMIDLVGIIGASTPAPIVDGTGGRDPFSKGSVSVAGGLNTGLNFTLDGAYHNNPYDNGYMSLPFPDALQEFKVETGATSAQNGVKSSGTVSLVTKSGTNQFHGDAFEFVRNGKFNARNAFANARDTIKRNQFGGTLGGPIIPGKVFFFGAYQGTTIRQAPSDQLAILPTAQMLAGDFTTFASPLCNAGRQITLRAPFVNNRMAPALFSKPAVAAMSKMPQTSDPCGKFRYGTAFLENDHMAVGRIDYQRSADHSIFGRYLLDHTFTPPAYELDKNPLNAIEAGKTGLAQAFTLGDTYLFGPSIVNAFHVTANRIAAAKTDANLDAAGLGPGDIGIKMFSWLPHRPRYTITGGFNSSTSGFRTGAFGPATGPTRAAVFGVNDDLSVVRGNHQLALGGQFSAWWTNSYSNDGATPTISFNGSVTGLGMGDFFLGNAATFSMGTTGDQNKRSRYFGLYAADTWKLSPKLTLNYGVRWEPYFPMIHTDNTVVHFDIDAMRKGIKTTRFTSVPAGVFFTGDPGFPAYRGINTKWLNFSPRLGLAWDVNGDGRTSIRASAGSFYDFPSNLYLQGFSNGAPFLPRFIRNNVDFQNPWANEPGGDPFPLPYGRWLGPNDARWPAYAPVTTVDYNTPNMHVYQWNLSVQRQVGANWLASATYLGSNTIHIWAVQELNPGIFLGTGPCTLAGVSYTTCSANANLNQRRQLSLENPATGQFFGSINRVDAGATASYNGLVLSLERRAARGITLGTNYTWSHCISDPGGAASIQGTGAVGYTNPGNRRADRGNCSTAGTDRRQIFNLSATAQTPQFAGKGLRMVGSGWRFSPIFRILSGAPLNITTSQDRALNGLPTQRVNQILADPYGDKSVKNFLNPAAFALPALGTFGNVGANSVRGPSTWQFDAAVSRSFQLRETQRMEFRAEAFNVTNAFRMDNPTTSIDSSLFGQVTSAKDPRIMQFSLKYLF
jgi:carboxypeptidase family protein/TonB-dependent receptor-like protein